MPKTLRLFLAEAPAREVVKKLAVLIALLMSCTGPACGSRSGIPKSGTMGAFSEPPESIEGMVRDVCVAHEGIQFMCCLYYSLGGTCLMICDFPKEEEWIVASYACHEPHPGNPALYDPGI